jgi:predicted esterase
VSAAPEIYSIATTTHGRVLVRRAAAPRGLIVGFHGYLESAETQLARLDGIPGAEHWTRVSVQGLHRVYRGRTQEVVAGWMTSQDRDEMIDDNVAYVADAVRAVARDVTAPIVFAGFSQGAAMAFRAAVRLGAAGVIAVGGDVPPELLRDPSPGFPPVLLVRGADDLLYTAAQFDADLAALRERGARVEAVVFAGGHEWTTAVSDAAARWLDLLGADA